MKTYHIVFYKQESDFFSTGKDYEASNPVEALEIWRKEYNVAVFATMYVRVKQPK